MFTFASVTQDFSICFQCQYRAAIRCRRRLGRRNHLLDSTPKRPIASAHRSLQKEALSVTFEEVQEPFFPLAEESDDVNLPQTIWKRMKHDDIYSTATLETDALGKPTNIIMLRKSRAKTLFRAHNAEAAIDNHHININPNEILENMQEEQAPVNIQGASIYIEDLRASWLSQLQKRHGTPTRTEYLQLLNSLQEGFTIPQLLYYYEAEIAKLQESVFELAHPYSTNFYTRSSWVPGCSMFPGKAAEQLLYLKYKYSENIKNNVDENESKSEGFGAFKRALRTKKSLAEIISQVLWNIKVPEEVGELNMWMEPVYFDILLSDRKSMFNELTETCGAKVDVSRSRRIIRITSDKDTCCDAFKSILRILENIHGVNFSFPPEPHQKVPHSDKPTLLKESLINQIERETGTIIRKIPHPTSNLKGVLTQYRIFYLGPDEDGLEGAKEKLIQASQSTSSKLPFVVWSDQECLQGRPRPVEVGSALPLVARGIEWSRWASPIKRISEVPLVDKGPDLSQDRSQSLLPSIFDILFRFTTPYPLNHLKSYKGLSWSEPAKRETFASLGQVVYPSEQLKALPGTLGAKTVRLRSKILRESLASQRQFFCGFSGVKFMLENANPSMQVGEDLRIRLRPSPEVLMQEEDGRIFPDVELRVKCDSATQTCEFSSARLVLDRREVDLLLPTETVDIRFCSTTHMPSDAKTDSQILNFLSSSNVDVFGQDAPTFPDALVLSIPAQSVCRPPSEGAPAQGAHESENFEDSVLKRSPEISVKYVVSNFEHWSHVSGNIMGLDFEHAVVAGRKTGRRDEIRMILHEEEGSQPDLAAFKADFKVLLGMIKKPRGAKQARGIDRNTAASLVLGV